MAEQNQYVHTMEYYSAIRKKNIINTLLIHVMWMYPENVVKEARLNDYIFYDFIYMKGS